jgi:hypothetical protein
MLPVYTELLVEPYHSQELQELRALQLSQGPSGEASGGQGPVDASLAGPGLGWLSHLPPANASFSSGQPVQASYSGPVQGDTWRLPPQPQSSSSQLPGLPILGQQVDPWQQQMVPWQPQLTGPAVQQLGQQTSLPPRDDDEDSYPSDEDADKRCYRESDHSHNPPPGPVKIRFTSKNYRGTRNVRVCERCWNWMKRPSSGCQVVLRGSSRLVVV